MYTKISSTSGDASEIRAQLHLYSNVNKEYKECCLLMHDRFQQLKSQRSFK